MPEDCTGDCVNFIVVLYITRLELDFIVVLPGVLAFQFGQSATDHLPFQKLDMILKNHQALHLLHQLQSELHPGRIEPLYIPEPTLKKMRVPTHLYKWNAVSICVPQDIRRYPLQSFFHSSFHILLEQFPICIIHKELIL